MRNQLMGSVVDGACGVRYGRHARRARRATASKALAVLFAALLVFSQLPTVYGSAWADDDAAASDAAVANAETTAGSHLSADSSFSAAVAAMVEADVRTQDAAPANDETELAATSDAAAETAPAVAAVAAATSIDKPTAVADLVYNGTTQTGVEEGEGYVLSGKASAKNAGDYEAVASLQEGYQWSDGTTDDVTLTWSIAKAELTATYDGETVSPGADPVLGVSVEGFVAGETALSAAGYKAPSVTAPASLAEGSYTLTPEGGSATNYDFTYVPGTLKVESATSGQLKEGTYTITANLSMPGDYNPVIPGATVYANNPSNPFTDRAGNSPVLDGNSSIGVQNTTPTTPLSKNAKLVVSADGSKTLELDILNPVFTTQEMGTCAELPDVQVTRKAPENSSVWDYGTYPTRISHISVKLTDDQVTGQKSYYFKGSKLYAVPLSLDIAPTGDIALELSVNYSSLPASALPDGVTPAPDNTVDDQSNADNNQNVTPADITGGNSDNGSNSDDNAAPAPTGSTEIQTTSDGYIAAGTYTVSANLWFDKATTGLPLNPHMTNSGFPPSTPVSNNATMTVDSSGHATVTAPVVIQDKVMTINSVYGGSITSFTGSSVTIDLGTPSASESTFTGTCTTEVTIGWLAKTIAAGIFNGVWDHTWSTNWEVDLGSTLPASGGGELPESAQAILNGENGVSTGDDAKASALASAETAAESAAKAAENKGGAKDSSSSTGVAKAAEDAAKAVTDIAEAATSNPAVIAGIVIGIVVVLAAAGAGVYAWRRKKGSAGASAAGAAGASEAAGGKAETPATDSAKQGE
jgi:hypothetical protein